MKKILDGMKRTMMAVNPPRYTALEGLQKAETASPFKILIGTVLSARTKDENTTKAAKALFKVYGTPQKLANAKVKDVEKLIKSVGFYHVKSKRIIEVAKLLISKYGGKVPSDIDKLVEIPGVGRKTANCVLVYAFEQPAIPVDTHVHRISNRLGLVSTKMPEETEMELRKTIPKKFWLDINNTFVMYGQNICKPISPMCDVCKIKNACNYFKNGKIEQTIKHLDRALEIDPDDLTGLRNKGIVLVNLNKYEEAINVIDELLENNPNDSRLLSRKGLALEILGKHSEALGYLDRALEIDPDDLTGLRNKGIVLVNLNKYEEAIKVIDRVLEIDPNDSEILLFKAIALESEGLDGEKFIQFYEKSMKISTNDYEMFCNIGFHITQIGEYENAIKYFDRVLSLEPNNPVATNGKRLAIRLQKLSSDERVELAKKYYPEDRPR